MPSICIFDYNNMLQLTLDRKDVQNETVFHKAVYEEMMKYKTAHLLLTKPYNNIYYQHYPFKKHKELYENFRDRMICFQHGFTDADLFFYDDCKYNTYYSIFLKDSIDINIYNYNWPVYPIIFYKEDEINFYYEIEDIGFSGFESMIFIKKQFFKSLDVKLDNFYIYNKKWVTNKKISSKSTIYSFIESCEDYISAIVIHNRRKGYKQTYPYFNYASQYLGDDIVIPFDPRARRKKYQVAFSQLDYYIKNIHKIDPEIINDNDL